jgi:hypothetical protein
LHSEDTTFIKTIACSILQLGSKEVRLLGSAQCCKKISDGPIHVAPSQNAFGFNG